jgi:hypothetical protein
LASGARAILILDQPGWQGARTSGFDQHLAAAVTATLTRGQQSREYLVVHAPELAVTTFSNPSTTSSITAAMLETRSSTSRGRSCLSGDAAQTLLDIAHRPELFEILAAFAALSTLRLRDPAPV